MEESPLNYVCGEDAPVSASTKVGNWDLLPYILTAVASVAISIVAMRLWNSRAIGAASTDPASTATEGVGQSKGAVARWLAKLSATRLGANPMLLGAGVLLIVAGAVFVLRPGEDDATSANPALSQLPGGTAENLDDVDTMIQRLASRLEQNPDDGEGYRMLGWSYVMTGHPDLAIPAYERALQLLPGDASVHAGYGEALVGVSENTVTGAAKSSFERALQIDPTQQRARYFMGLWDAQNGREQQAIETWITLANEGPADAPWQADVRREIARVSTSLGIDVSGRLTPSAPAAAQTEPPALDPATVQQATQLPPAQQQAMVAGMVDGLAQRLAANPADADGWIRLLRSRMVLAQTQQAVADLRAARAGLSGDAAGLGRVNAAAAELEVPGA